MTTRKTKVGWVESLRPVRRSETGNRLRELARWFDTHPDVEIPSGLRPGNSTYYSYQNKDEMSEIVKKIGSFKKEYTEYDFEAVVEVAGFTLKWYTSRSNVCTKKVVGKKLVEAQVIPERIIAAHEEDVVEWECDTPLLKSQGNTELDELEISE